MQKGFILIGCGDEFASRLELAIHALKRFSKQEIVAVVCGVSIPLKHDQVISVTPEKNISHHDQSRLIKSSIYSIIGNFPGRLCYLDSDALAVSDSIDDIFRFDFAPVCFSPDHFMTVSKFAKYALAPENPWNLDLGAALRHEFSVEIPADWPLWNGGMFTFSAEAEQFFDRWNANTRRILHSEYWLSRDQTSLIATVFQMNMHDNKTIPSEFNWLVRHSGRWNSRTDFDERGFSYDGKKIHVMHFIPGFDSSYGDTSVREWTQVRQLLETDIEK